jgi:hypothetical protein
MTTSTKQAIKFYASTLSALLLFAVIAAAMGHLVEFGW